MSDVREPKSPEFPTLGYLLLRDGHAVPLTGISPEHIKLGAKALVPNPDIERLKHQRRLNAIVDRLGFRGDFGDFTNTGWGDFERFLRRNECLKQAQIFPADTGGCIDLFFRREPDRRQLADRIFEAPGPLPTRVFLGYGIDWAHTWDRGNGHAAPVEAFSTVGGDPATARRRAEALFARRHKLMEQWGFLDDKLVWKPSLPLVDRIYWEKGHDQNRETHREQVRDAIRAFRDVFDHRPEGWVDVLRFNDRLVVLRAHDGAWDLLWRAYRKDAPPEQESAAIWAGLAPADLPAKLMDGGSRARLVYYRQEFWDEKEAHEAEQAFYDRGGTQMERRATSSVDVRVAWLREQGLLPAPTKKRWNGPLPAGFREVTIAGRRLAISEFVDVGSFRRMLSESGYEDRRPESNEPWNRANEGEPDAAPVGCSQVDALAYYAFVEKQLGTALRLPTKAELRAIHPFHSERYDQLSGADFLWESFPPRPLQRGDDATPRVDVPSVVTWSEPRFLEPGPDVPEFPPPNGVFTRSRKRWVEDFPPRARWSEDLRLVEYGGLHFIDAWDAYEWCAEPEWIHGRFWEGGIGSKSWGAYKNVKVSFRLVLELEE